MMHMILVYIAILATRVAIVATVSIPPQIVYSNTS
jgi:hypothetical protein